MASPQHNFFLEKAIQKAEESLLSGGFPAGAIIVKDNQIIGEGISIGNILYDPTSHGELSCIRNASRHVQSTNLANAILYASMQPCLMCFGATMWCGITDIFYACPMSKVAKEYYGGTYDTSVFQSHLIHPVRQTHVAELEEKSLALVRRWENSLS